MIQEERVEIAELFDEDDLLFMPDDAETGEATSAGAIVNIRNFIFTGYMDDNFDVDILYDAGCEYSEIEEGYIELHEEFDDFAEKLQGAGHKVYTSETMDEYLQSRGYTYKCSDFRNW